MMVVSLQRLRQYIVLTLVHVAMLEAYRILLLPTGYKSHMIYMHQIGAALASHGHKVHCVIGDHRENTDFITGRGMKVLKYRTPERAITWDYPDWQEQVFAARSVPYLAASVGKQNICSLQHTI